MILTLLYYIFFSSAVFFYGIGVNDSTIVCDSIHEQLLPLIKMIASIVSTTLLCFVIIKNILAPLGITEMYPLIVLLVFFVISIFFESLIRITGQKNTAEFNISYLIILLALNESISLLHATIISIACFAAFAIVLPILYSIKKRIDIVGNLELHGNRRSLVLVSLAILATVLAVCNASWLTPGVLQ